MQDPRLSARERTRSSPQEHPTAVGGLPDSEPGLNADTLDLPEIYLKPAYALIAASESSDLRGRTRRRALHWS